MDTNHLNTYLNLIEALLHCAKGKEWLLLQQHEDLISPELLTVMEQVADRLHAEGNAAAAKFLNYWKVQLNYLLQQNTPTENPAKSRAQSYLTLIQTILGCEKGDEIAILSQHPELMDAGLIYTMNQVAAQLAAKGDRDIAIYLKHLAAEVNRIWLHPDERQAPRSSPSVNEESHTPPSPESSTANNLAHDEDVFSVPAAPPMVAVAPLVESSPSLPPPNSYINELLENISNRLEKLETLLSKHPTRSDPLWYMPILERAETHGWIISSEEVEQLIGIKPHCAPGENSFTRGCWKFARAGKIGTHSSWQVSKENTNQFGDALPDTVTTDSDGKVLEPELSSPWSETN